MGWIPSLKVKPNLSKFIDFTKVRMDYVVVAESTVIPEIEAVLKQEQEAAEKQSTAQSIKWKLTRMAAKREGLPDFHVYLSWVKKNDNTLSVTYVTNYGLREMDFDRAIKNALCEFDDVKMTRMTSEGVPFEVNR